MSDPRFSYKGPGEIYDELVGKRKVPDVPAVAGPARSEPESPSSPEQVQDDTSPGPSVPVFDGGAALLAQLHKMQQARVIEADQRLVQTILKAQQRSAERVARATGAPNAQAAPARPSHSSDEMADTRAPDD